MYNSITLYVGDLEDILSSAWSIQLIPFKNYKKKLEEAKTQLLMPILEVSEPHDALPVYDQSQQYIPTEEGSQFIKYQNHRLAFQLKEFQTLNKSLEKCNRDLKIALDKERILTSKLIKQKETVNTTEDTLSMRKVESSTDKDELIRLLENKFDEEKKQEKELREGLNQEIDRLKQLLENKTNKSVKEVAVQFDFLVPQFGK